MGSAAELWAVVLANGHRREDVQAWLLPSSAHATAATAAPSYPDR